MPQTQQQIAQLAGQLGAAIGELIGLNPTTFDASQLGDNVSKSLTVRDWVVANKTGSIVTHAQDCYNTLSGFSGTGIATSLLNAPKADANAVVAGLA